MSSETTPQPTPPTQPIPILITIPLHIYLAASWGFRERCVLDRAIGETILRLDPKETICHVEFNENTPNVVTVWKTKEWKEDYHRITKLRQDCERERLISALTRELIVKLTTVMSTHPLTMAMDDERKEKMARKLISKQSWAGIRNLGVDCSELEDVMNKGTT
jgi:hypothetical protein